MTIRRIEPGSRLSRAVVHGSLVFLAGLTADDLTQDVTGQTRQILAKIDRTLEEAGTDKSKLLSAQIWLRDIATFAAMNQAWEAWLDKANPPARATVEARLANDRILVEIMAVAARG